jgi:hypothetical protein
MSVRFFAPITKINEATREVEGVLALEVKDKQGEIMDYATSKEYFQSWSDEIYKISSGKSYGNVREMHSKNAVGKLSQSLVFDDDKKEIRAVSEVVDDNTWDKVNKGVLNGYSIGGDYVKRWNDTVQKAKRYTVKPLEVSLVDNPCMYGAEFTSVRGDGEVEVRKFSGNKDVTQIWDCGRECSVKHLAKADAQHCEGEQVEKLSFVNGNLFGEEEDNTNVEKSALAEETAKVAEPNTNEGDEEMDKETVEKMTKDIESSVAKSVGNTLGTVLKEILPGVINEAMKDRDEDVKALAEAVQKMAGLPSKTTVVTKAADNRAGKKKSKPAEEPKTVEKTQNREDLVGDMKMALSKSYGFDEPLPANGPDDDEDEEENEEEEE